MSYWDKRISRRMALRASAAGGVGVAALSLIGCGGGDSGPKEEATGLVNKPVDTGGQAKAGGILSRIATNDTAGFDTARANNSTVSGHGAHSYSRLNKFARVKYPNRADGSIEADAAIGWETTADGLTTTMKLRPNMKLDNRAPTNGRPLNSADVAFSWNLYATVNAERDILANAVDPDAPIIRMETPDAQTIVIKSAFPYGPLLAMTAFRRYMQIMPVESDGGFNTKETMRGSGAWQLTEYQSSSKFEYRKNPDWYDASKNYLDGITITIIPEYASAMAQFRTGRLWEFEVRQEDILATKRDDPNLVLFQKDQFLRENGPHYRFGQLSPFKDERLRQAASMLIDRDLWLDTFANISKFKSEGLEVEGRWNSSISAGENAFWLDPKGKGLGDAAKYYQYNPAEAKKLVQAAGFANGVETEFEWTINQYGNDYLRSAEVIRGMLEANGDFKFKPNPVDYNSIHAPLYHLNKGQFPGMMAGSQGARAELDGWLFGAGKSGTNKTYAPDNDSVFDAMIVGQRKELDAKKRVELIQEIQRYAAQHMKWIIAPGQGLGFTLHQPWLSNKGTFRYWDGGGDIPQENLRDLWYDASKKPA